MYGVYSQQASGGASVPEVLIIGGNNSRVFRSTDDGLSFTTQIIYHPSAPSTATTWSKVFYCNGKFFISGVNGCMVSHDYGLTWVNIINEEMRSIVWNGTYYFAGIGYQIRRSADLATWTALTPSGSLYQRGDDLCVDNNNNVYWSQNRNTSVSTYLSIQKCVAPYNSGNISSINAGTPGAIPTGTNGRLYKTSNGLILSTYNGNTQQRIYSTTNYATLTAASGSYQVTQSVLFDIVVGEYAYKFGPNTQSIRGRGTPVIDVLSTTTSPNNLGVHFMDTNGTTFVARVSGTTTAVWTRDVTANSTAWTSTNMGFNPLNVFYTGKSFLVMNGSNLRRSETGLGGWSTATNPFSNQLNNSANINPASSYKPSY